MYLLTHLKLNTTSSSLSLGNIPSCLLWLAPNLIKELRLELIYYTLKDDCETAEIEGELISQLLGAKNTIFAVPQDQNQPQMILTL